MSVATRAAGLSPSPIRRMGLDAPAGTIDLALGEPGWDLPGPARDALAACGAQDGPLRYGPNSSEPALVEAVAGQHGSRADQVMVTAGSQAALFALFQAHVEPGTVVLVPDPGFVAYRTLAQLCGARPVGYPAGPGTGPDGGLDPEPLLALLEQQGDVSMVVLNHPANPTGTVADASALTRVAAACRRRGVLLVSDEVYRELWTGRRPVGLHDVVDPEQGPTVVLGSVSKAFGAPGLRIGWAVAGAEVLAPARLVHTAMTSAPARPSQAAATALLRSADTVLPAAREHLRRRWAAAHAAAPGLVAAGDRAGFYLWLPLPPGVPPGRTQEFALRLRDTAGVGTVPGDAFGPAGAGHLRVSLGGPVPGLEEGLARLTPWWEA